jgi:hypothetical protein
MSIFISDEELIRAEILANRCKGVCEMGKLLHKFVSGYLLVSKELKKVDYEVWKRIHNDTDDVGDG